METTKWESLEEGKNPLFHHHNHKVYFLIHRYSQSYIDAGGKGWGANSRWLRSLDGGLFSVSPERESSHEYSMKREILNSLSPSDRMIHEEEGWANAPPPCIPITRKHIYICSESERAFPNMRASWLNQNPEHIVLQASGLERIQWTFFVHTSVLRYSRS